MFWHTARRPTLYAFMDRHITAAYCFALSCHNNEKQRDEWREVAKRGPVVWFEKSLYNGKCGDQAHCSRHERGSMVVAQPLS